MVCDSFTDRGVNEKQRAASLRGRRETPTTVRPAGPTADYWFERRARSPRKEDWARLFRPSTAPSVAKINAECMAIRRCRNSCRGLRCFMAAVSEFQLELASSTALASRRPRWPCKPVCPILRTWTVSSLFGMARTFTLALNGISCLYLPSAQRSL